MGGKVQCLSKKVGGKTTGRVTGFGPLRPVITTVHFKCGHWTSVAPLAPACCSEGTIDIAKTLPVAEIQTS